MTVSLAALAKRWIGIGQLALAGNRGGQQDSTGVEGIQSGEMELLFRREGMVVFQAGSSAVIRNNPENTLVLFFRRRFFWNIGSLAEGAWRHENESQPDRKERDARVSRRKTHS